MAENAKCLIFDQSQHKHIFTRRERNDPFMIKQKQTNTFTYMLYTDYMAKSNVIIKTLSLHEKAQSYIHRVCQIHKQMCKYIQLKQLVYLLVL